MIYAWEIAMKLRIIAVTLFAFLFSPPAIADDDYATIGGLRKSCKAWLNSDTSVAYFDQGVCLGWVISESNWRYAACIYKSNMASPGQYSVSGARDVSGHSYEALAQAFVNWADNNPDWWVNAPFFLSTNPDFWAEFPCENSN